MFNRRYYHRDGKWIPGKINGYDKDYINNCYIPYYDAWYCSECGFFIQQKCRPYWLYCPVCGANMEISNTKYHDNREYLQGAIRLQVYDNN